MTPRTKAPRTDAPVDEQALGRHERRGAHHTAGFLRESFGHGLPVPRGPRSPPMIWMCAATPRMRVRISFSKPFITDITVISAAMPSEIPRIEMNEMKEMKWFAALGAGIPKADEKLERLHAGIIADNPIPCRSPS